MIDDTIKTDNTKQVKDNILTVGPYLKHIQKGNPKAMPFSRNWCQYIRFLNLLDKDHRARAEKPNLLPKSACIVFDLEGCLQQNVWIVFNFKWQVFLQEL